MSINFNINSKHFFNLLRFVSLIILCGNFQINAETTLKTGRHLRYPNSCIDITNGLSHNGVTDIVMDKQGYLWFATFDGLNRYNGEEIKIYKNTEDQQIFPIDRIRALDFDSKGLMWIATNAGVTIYDPNKESFKIIYSQYNRKKMLY